MSADFDYKRDFLKISEGLDKYLSEYEHDGCKSIACYFYRKKETISIWLNNLFSCDKHNEDVFYDEDDTVYHGYDVFRDEELLSSFNRKSLSDELLSIKEETFSEMLLELIDESGLSDPDVYKRANVDRRLYSKIRSNENYVPSKGTAISFCFALKLNINSSLRLLNSAGYTFSKSSRFDVIIVYLINHGIHELNLVNYILTKYGEKPLKK